MKRPLAYVTAAWRGDACEVTEQAAKYCRIVYDAGYSPICPMLYLPLFLNDVVPEEHKSGIDMGRDLLRRSRVLVVCGNYVNEAVKNDIAVAQRLGITATTLEGMTMWTTRTPLYKSHFWTKCPEVVTCRLYGRLFSWPGKTPEKWRLYAVLFFRY